MDTISKGLTYDEGSAEVFVNGKSAGKVEPTAISYSGEEEKYKGGSVLTWDLGDIKLTPYNAGKNAVITIKYTATLNNNAVIGSAGNPNMMHIEYSNNPNSTDDKYTGKTPDDTNIVFTYKTVVNKVDNKTQPLKGAEFKLEKFVASDNGKDTYNTVKGDWTEITRKMINDEGTTFTWSGLDDGEYRIVETKTPGGYNSIEDIYFTVTAAHDPISDNPGLTSLTGTATSGEVTFTPVESDGSLSTDVVNQKGATLPSTGGIGTRIFYAVGAVLMIGAAVILITRKRSAK